MSSPPIGKRDLQQSSPKTTGMPPLPMGERSLPQSSPKTAGMFPLPTGERSLPQSSPKTTGMSPQSIGEHSLPQPSPKTTGMSPQSIGEHSLPQSSPKTTGMSPQPISEHSLLKSNSKTFLISSPPIDERSPLKSKSNTVGMSSFPLSEYHQSNSSKSIGVRFMLPDDHKSMSTASSLSPELGRFYFDDESTATNHLPRGWKEFIQPRPLRFRDTREEQNYHLQLASSMRRRTIGFSALLLLSCTVESVPHLMGEIHKSRLWGIPVINVNFGFKFGCALLEFMALFVTSFSSFFVPQNYIEPCILIGFFCVILAFSTSACLDIMDRLPKSPLEIALLVPANCLQMLCMIVYIDFVYCLRPIFAIPLHVGSGVGALVLAICSFTKFWRERYVLTNSEGETVAVNPYQNVAMGITIWAGFVVFIVAICVSYAGAYTVDLQRRIIFHAVPTLSPPLPFRTRKNASDVRSESPSGASTGIDLLRTTNKEIAQVVEDLRQMIVTARHGSPGGTGHLDWLLPTIEEIERLQHVCVGVMTNATNLYQPVRSPKSPDSGDDDVYAWVDHMCNVAADRRLQRGPTVREMNYNKPLSSSDSDSEEMDGSLSPSVVTATTQFTSEIRDALAPTEDEMKTIQNLYRPPVDHPAKLKVGVNWNLSILDLNNETIGGHTLVFVGYFAIKTSVSSLVVSDAKIENRLLRLLLELESMYHPLLYHNKEHGATVCHLILCLLKALRIASNCPAEELLATLIAACAHDVGHIGRDNKFCANTKSNLSLVYNDRTILENYHCYLLFSLLKRNECNVFHSMSTAMSNSLRQWIIDLIFATDMAVHFSILSEFRLRREATDFDYVFNLEDRLLVSKMCLKLADIGHASLSWDLHRQWSTRVQDEFFAQGDHERSQGLPVSPLCDRLTSDLPRGQTGFLQVVVIPLINEIESVDSSGWVSRAVKNQTLENFLLWQKELSPDSVASIRRRILST